MHNYKYDRIDQNGYQRILVCFSEFLIQEASGNDFLTAGLYKYCQEYKYELKQRERIIHKTYITVKNRNTSTKRVGCKSYNESDPFCQ